MAERIATPPIGIDLGTTNSCIGIWQNGTVEIILNQQGNTDMRGYKGKDAERLAIMNSYDTSLMKRSIGKDDRDKPMISISEDQRKPKQPSAMEISSMILRNLCNTARDTLKCPINNVVISVPACFNDSQRFATVEAGKMADLNVMRIINEPTAAAIAYGFNKIENNGDGANKKNVLIFDLGGGTLDVSILTMERGNYEVKATVGDAHLGGVDFDNRLMEHCNKKLQEKGRPMPKDLRTLCENAKKALSTTEETRIVNFICINRGEFEKLNNDLFDKCIDIVEKCLVDANMYRSSIHDVVLIGRSTSIPKVQKMLREFFDGKELTMGITTGKNNKEAVATGAAIQAAILVGGMSDYVPNLVVSDITTHSLGIRIGELDEFMIPRKTVIPTTKKMNLTADQKKLLIKVYEGEKTEIEDNNLLVELTSSNGAISFGPNDDVCFNVDENGIFTISVENKMPGQRKITMIPITGDLQEQKLKGDKKSFLHDMCTETQRIFKGTVKKLMPPNEGP